MTNLMPYLDQINQISTKNDRWLFIAVLILFLAAIFWAFRWLINKYERLVDKSEVNQTSYSESLLNINAEQSKRAEGLAVVLSDCREVMSECRDTIKENTEFFRKMHDK